MLVFWEQRLVVLATPKTGSTAIATALVPAAALSVVRPPVMKHTSLQRFNRFVRPWLAATSGHEFTVVALMREPRDWLGSWYRFRRREDLPDPARSTQALSFDQFVQGYCQTPQPPFAAVGAQATFLRPGAGREADRLFRYDDLGSFVAFLEDRLSLKIALPRENVSPVAALDLTAATERLLLRHAQADFELYESLR